MNKLNLIIIFVLFGTIHTRQIGSISDHIFTYSYSFQTNDLPITLQNITACSACICTAFMSSINYVAINCYNNNTCLLLPSSASIIGIVPSQDNSLYILSSTIIPLITVASSTSLSPTSIPDTTSTPSSTSSISTSTSSSSTSLTSTSRTTSSTTSRTTSTSSTTSSTTSSSTSSTTSSTSSTSKTTTSTTSSTSSTTSSTSSTSSSTSSTTSSTSSTSTSTSSTPTSSSSTPTTIGGSANSGSGNFGYDNNQYPGHG
ncbi:unnamed protein product [Adineta steineri]|uniref:Uncharacterized protein n=1 Tax=Adineta steineri TaxID=433720 RepID=A0A814V614_9BILA|nr:unnamed protein product [Adineta steineri]